MVRNVVDVGLAFRLKSQGSFCVCAQPMGDNVTSSLIGWALTQNDPWKPSIFLPLCSDEMWYCGCQTTGKKSVVCLISYFSHPENGQPKIDAVRLRWYESQFNLLGPSEAICRRICGLALDQVMACHLHGACATIKSDYIPVIFLQDILSRYSISLISSCKEILLIFEQT